MLKQNRADPPWSSPILSGCWDLLLSLSLNPKFQSHISISHSHSPVHNVFLGTKDTEARFLCLTSPPQLVLLESSKFLSFMCKRQTFEAPSFAAYPLRKVFGFPIDR